jgi:uncharacterized protein (UPF0147 family)
MQQLRRISLDKSLPKQARANVWTFLFHLRKMTQIA